MVFNLNRRKCIKYQNCVMEFNCLVSFSLFGGRSALSLVKQQSFKMILRHYRCGVYEYYWMCLRGTRAKLAVVPLLAAFLPPCSQGSNAGSFLTFSDSLPSFGWARQNFSVVYLWFSWWTAVPVPKNSRMGCILLEQL